VLSFFTRIATGLALSDSQCGYTALNRNAYERVPLHALWHGYGYPNDLIGWLARHRLRVRDVVVRPIYADEASGVRFHHALFVVPYVLLRVMLRRVGTSLRDRLVPARARATMPVAMVGLITSDSTLPPHES
jgi:hypothetical protein